MSDDTIQKSNKKAQVLVLDTLNDLFTDAASDNDKKQPISLGAVIIYSDGTVSSHMAGDLDRILLTGALTDLVNQIFYECKQREINEQVEKVMCNLHLASMPTGGGKKPNWKGWIMRNKIACVSTMKCFEHLMRECNLKKTQQVFHLVGSIDDIQGANFSSVLVLGDSFYQLRNVQELIDRATFRVVKWTPKKRKFW